MKELDLDELLNSVSEEVNLSETQESQKRMSQESQETQESQVTLDDLSDKMFKKDIERVKELASQSEDSDKYLEEYIKDIQGSIREYFSERHRINAEIDELRSELKNIREGMKEEGIKITAVDKAFKEMVSELKEDSQDAILIESVKNMIKKDPVLYGMVREEAN